MLTETERVKKLIQDIKDLAVACKAEGVGDKVDFKRIFSVLKEKRKGDYKWCEDTLEIIQLECEIWDSNNPEDPRSARLKKIVELIDSITVHSMGERIRAEA